MEEKPRQQRRSLRVSLPSRPTIPAIPTSRPSYPPLPHHPTTPTPKLYPHFPDPHPTTPAPTPSKHRISSLSATRPATKKTTTSLSTLFLLLFSLRSLYSLLPFLRSSPSSFSIFPFSFLVSLLSFLLTLSFSLFSKSIFSPTSITGSQHKQLFSKSLLLATVFLLRFQALRYCGTAAMILAEFSGTISARFLFDGQNRNFIKNRHMIKVRGFLALSVGLLFLSLSWDRVECFPFSFINLDKLGLFSFLPDGNCVRIWPLLLPFLSGFLGCYERLSMNSVDVKELGPKRIRLISLFYTTIVLFIPAVISMFVFEAEGDSVSVRNLGWPLANTVVFGVLLSENYTDDYKVVSLKDFRTEFLITFVCTLVLELFYYPELSLWGLLLCGLLFGIAVRELNPFYSNYVELGSEPSGSLTSLIMKPIRHILNERKSRKIALFLLINTGYMVVEFIVGFMSNSLGLISDACHMLFDCAALAIGLYASYLSRLPANGEYNYGRGRFEVLSGYVNAVFLVLVGALIVLESLERILEPQEISTNSLLTVSIGGLVVNVVGLIFFHDEHHHAHGGSCSHSNADGHTHTHSHAKSHSNHSRDHIGHNHGVHSKHQKNHEHHNDQCTGAQCSDQDYRIHEHNHHHHEDHHDHHHHHDHEHQHDHHHDCEHQHDHHHDHHHDREHQHDHHHDHEHQRNHHGEHHDHHDHNHVHGHEHDHKHDHELQHNHHEGHFHGIISVTATGQGPEKHQHLHIDHNMEGIFLHVLADTLGSVGVVISTLLIRYKGWLVADPAASIFISVLIVSSVIPLLRNSAEILLQRVPKAHERALKEAVRSIMKIKGVSGIQKLHVWSFTSTDVVGTIRLRVSSETDKGSTKAQVSDILHDAGVKDLTVEVECVQSNQQNGPIS